MKKRTLSRSFGFEKLEGRRLLAADCAMQAMPEIESIEPAHCEVASVDCPTEDIAAAEIEAVEVPAEEIPAADIPQAPLDSTSDSTVESEVVDTGSTTPETLDPRVLDLADGMDGYFGSINAENPAETLEFTAAEDGMVDVVLASSFGDDLALLTVSDSQGNVIETQLESLEGFDMLSFEVVEGETYQLSITTDNADCEGNFQLTVGFAAHVDQHADEIGAESTELELVDDHAELEGRLESAGDRDTFRFTATATGAVTLELHETVDNARIGLDVSVQDSQENILANGATNEMLQISFDVDAGQEYFVSIAAGEGQKGTYRFDLDLNPSSELPPTDIAADIVTDESVEAETIESDIIESDEIISEVTDAELADDQTTDIEDGNPTSADPTSGEPSGSEIVANLDETDANIDPDLVNTIDESVEADTVDEIVAAELDAPVVCALVQAEVEEGESTSIDEPVEDAPVEDTTTDAIATETGDQQSEGELVESTDDQSGDALLDDGLVNSWVDCGEGDAIGESDDSQLDPELGDEIDLETGGDDLIATTGSEIVEGETDNGDLVFSFADQEAVDDFFATLGSEIELHFDFSLGRHFVDDVFSQV